MKEWKRRNYLEPLNVIPELDTSSYEDVKDSLEELQMLTGDETPIRGWSIQQMLELQEKLQQQMFEMEANNEEDL